MMKFTISLIMTILALFPYQSTGQHMDQTLHQKLEELVKDFKGDIGIYVYHLETGQEAGIHQDKIFPTASLIKVPIMIGMFDNILKGKFNYHDAVIYDDSFAVEGSGFMQYFENKTPIDLSIPITLSITYSDNTAAIWSQHMAGGGTAVNQWLQDHGYQFTRVNSRTKGRENDYKNYGWGQTTPREMAQLFVSIRKNEILTRAACERMYRNLTNIYWDDWSLSQIPPNVQTASKQGMLDASRSEVVLVNAPHGDYVFYIGTNHIKDQRYMPDNESWQMARDLSRLLWNYFEPDSDWQPAADIDFFMDHSNDANRY